jgi:hypothetical protein
VKLALNIFAARIVLEAARGALMWVWVEVLNFNTRPAVKRLPAPCEIPEAEPHPAAPFVAHDVSTYF